jgi:glycosyltransferase involved in cell wall biosynthesis
LSQSLTFIVPGDPDQRTGGYLYDARIVAELRGLGWQVRHLGLAGQFPLADATAFESLAGTLAGLESGATVVMDGLALGGLPGAVAGHAERLTLIALVHHPLADETGLTPKDREALLTLEREALSHCREVIVTSPFTAQRLQELGLTQHQTVVVEPGADPAEPSATVLHRLARDHRPEQEHILCVASLTPRKGQDLLLHALADLTEHPWRCRLSGSEQRDPKFAGRIRELTQSLALSDRVECLGERDEAELVADYHWASVLVLPSHFEGYGMVVTEALARGLPVIATTGGALSTTVPPEASLRVPAGDTTALRTALDHWLRDQALRQRLTEAALQYRKQLTCWNQAGKRFDDALRAVRTKAA